MHNPALLKRAASIASPIVGEKHVVQATAATADASATIAEKKSVSEVDAAEAAAAAAVKKLLLESTDSLVSDGQLFNSLQFRLFAEGVVQNPVANRHAVRVEFTNQSLRFGRTFLVRFRIWLAVY